jgi:hypothetical protein
MAARDRDESTIKCPKCGKTGVAEHSTGDHPYMRSDEFSIDKLPEGFEVVKETKWRYESSVQCTDCKVPFQI